MGPRPVPGKGSGIFYHTSKPGHRWAPTAGCTQVGNPRQMRWLLTWLRPSAQKAIIVITDDSAQCAYGDGELNLKVGEKDADPFEDALAFHRALLAKSPEQFGTFLASETEKMGKVIKAAGISVK